MPKPRSGAYPRRLVTVGDHIRAKRLDRGLLQREVARQMKVSVFTIINWEKGETQPLVWYGPRIIKFLGYDPMPEPRSFAARVWSTRWRRGLTQRALAEELGVDEGTVSAWEHHGQRPASLLRMRVNEFLAGVALDDEKST